MFMSALNGMCSVCTINVFFYQLNFSRRCLRLFRLVFRKTLKSVSLEDQNMIRSLLVPSSVFILILYCFFFWVLTNILNVLKEKFSIPIRKKKLADLFDQSGSFFPSFSSSTCGYHQHTLQLILKN